jgi:DNA polymerase III sliding clamp (beta) subunit (PCNA family)
MKLLIASTKLAKAARTAALAVRHEMGRRSAILNCRRRTGDGNLSIYGSDLDTGITALANCDVIEPGEAIVNVQRLADITAKFRGDVLIHTAANDLVVECGRSRFALTMLPIDDAPPPLAVEGDSPAIALTAADVMALFAGAAAGAASDDKQIYLSGPVLFSESTDFGHRLCAVGTDGVVLSYVATTAGCPDLGKGRIIHRRTCKRAVDLFGETGAVVRLSENLVELASDSVQLVAKLIGAEPTAWRSMVPPVEMINTAIVARADLQGSLERCMAVINHLTGDLTKSSPSVTLWWDASVCEEVRTAYGDIGSAPACRDAVPAKALTGRVAVSINPKHLLHLLEGLGGDDISLSAKDRASPLRVDAGPDRFAVLSPMRDFLHISEEAA